MKCQQCNNEVSLPFRCSYCQGYFCADHKLPENHRCPNLQEPKQRYLREEKEPKQEQPIEEGRFYFIKEPEEGPKQELQKTKKKLTPQIFAFCIILMVVGATVAYASYNFGHSIGSNIAYNKGYNFGLSKGYDEGYVNGNLSGYQKGYEIGYVRGVTDGAGRGYNIRDPTYQEALNFIASDHTEQHQYSSTYTCFDFTADFKMNAFRAGYKCGFVYIEFTGSAHAIVAFNTTNHGLIFIEPQSDDIVTLTIGQHYWDRTKYIPSYDDTIVRFVVIW